MAYIVSVIPKRSAPFGINEMTAKKISAIKRVLRKRKGVNDIGGEVIVSSYKTKAAAYTAAAAVRNHVHGATAKVFPEYDSPF
jgi:hypothetical protein